jgi:hypothetical protein
MELHKQRVLRMALAKHATEEMSNQSEEEGGSLGWRMVKAKVRRLEQPLMT